MSLVNDINKCEFLMLYNVAHQHFRDMHNSVNQYFVKRPQCRIINLCIGEISIQIVWKISKFQWNPVGKSC